MVSCTKIIVLFFLSSSSVSGFGFPSPQSMLGKRANRLTKLPMSDVAAELPRGGQGDQGEGTATIPSEVFNLVKAIAGAGVLSLPAGEFHVVL